MSQQTPQNPERESLESSREIKVSATLDRVEHVARRLRRCAFRSTDRLAGIRGSQLNSAVRRLLRSIGRNLQAVDVHLYLVRLDGDKIGPVALKYHSGRSAVRPELGIAERFQFQLFSPAIQSALLNDQIANVARESSAGGRIVQGLMHHLNCESYLLCPLQLNGNLRGIIAVALPERLDDPPRQILELLKLNGSILLNNVVRVRRERYQRRELRQWRQIANQACDFAISIDETFVVRDTTQFGLGDTTPQLNGLRLDDIVTRNFQDEVRKQIRKAVDGPGVRTCDFQVSLGHEGPRWFLARIEPAGAAQDAFATLYLTDNNSDKVLKERIRELMNQLVKANRLGLLGQMSTEFAHQLNQPLQAMLNYCNIMQRRLKKGTATDDNAAVSLQNIETSILHSADIIQRIRDFVKFRTLCTEEVELQEIIEHAMMMVLPTARGWNADLISPAEVPAAIVAVDNAQTIHVFVNLMVNALEACREFGVDRPRVELYVRESPSEGVLTVAVKDNGPGLPEGDPNMVFEKFYTEKKDGLGLGLAISHDVCTSQGGRLYAKNNKDGNGCTFFVELPLLRDTGSDTAEIETLPETELPAD